MEEDYRKKLKRREKERELRRKTVARKKKMLLAGAGEAVLIVILAVSLNVLKRQDKAAASEMKEGAKKEEVVSFTVSAARDCTLGTDAYFDYATGFTGKYDAVQNPAYFFEKVKPFFETDDLTIVNMEGTLTESDTREEKQFAFKADREYADILTAGAVEAANLANNHSKDYGEVSYTDTIAALDAVGVTSFGYDRTAVMEVKGIKVGLVGTYELADHMDCEKGMKENIEALKEQGTQVIIASFHWGAEREYVPNDVQIALAILLLTVARI